jgi:hypothetical protein
VSQTSCAGNLAEGLILEGHRRTQNAQVPSAEFKLRPEGAHTIGLRFRRDRKEAIVINLAGAVQARARFARDGSDEQPPGRSAIWAWPRPGIGVVRSGGCQLFSIRRSVLKITKEGSSDLSRVFRKSSRKS